jgi:hypothetical protein
MTDGQGAFLIAVGAMYAITHAITAAANWPDERTQWRKEDYRRALALIFGGPIVFWGTALIRALRAAELGELLPTIRSRKKELTPGQLSVVQGGELSEPQERQQ